MSHAQVSYQPAVCGTQVLSRPHARGKFLFVGAEKIYVRGVTYGTFRPDNENNHFPDAEVVAHDFALMTANGVNALRTYTVPPRWLLDLAAHYGLRVMVGLPWQQHVTFLDDRAQTQAIVDTVRAGVRACVGHPAVLCYAIGNEIPATVVRWYGARRVEQFLKRLYKAAKAEDPDALFTYVNYPSTEYLKLSFLDFMCFNVYLESQENLDAYLARLQNIAGEKPLVMAEIGLDSQRNGEQRQAEVMDWQIRTSFAAGCAGTFAFSWTDEWYRGGFDIEDWDFGLVTRERQPKQALAAVHRVFSETPFPANLKWPRISVVVCSYNGARTIRDCFDNLLNLEYPDYEVIVVNDGSKDRTAAITSEYGFRLINTENRGLSSARNTGMEAATGKIVAYIDDDAYPDPHWLTYLAATFINTEYVAVGGPNIAPPGDGEIAACVAHAPGGPVHVLLSDREAEHIPGCNFAVRKSALESIGGFDPRFRTAGDDVDVCWRLLQQGWKIGFNPAAVVWHHRRNSLRTYWKQQKGYGRAEALLEAKWPEKYNSAGHFTWSGRLYGNGVTRAIGSLRGRIYQGSWGTALFQSVYEPAANGFGSLPLMPEWYLFIAALTVVSLLGFSWGPLLLGLPLLLLAVGTVIFQSIRSAEQADFDRASRSPTQNFLSLSLIASLHFLQPLARLIGRIGSGLTVWRRRGGARVVWPWPRNTSVWSEEWHSSEDWLRAAEEDMVRDGAVVRRGGDFDRWDLEVRGGLLGCARMLMVIEEHGGGKQLVRFRTWPRFAPLALVIDLSFALLACGAALNQAWVAWTILTMISALFGFRLFQECAAAESAIVYTVENGIKEKAAALSALRLTNEPGRP